MTDDAQAALFPGFEAKMLEGDGTEIFCRVGGSGPPILLIHGYPQNHAMWHKIAAPLAEIFTVVMIDLRGYGQSGIPDSDQTHEPYSKRVMAKDAIKIMTALGYETFAVVGHDRGGRVAYRLALDHPDHVIALCVLDIIPTWSMWKNFNARLGMAVYHWTFFAQPSPLPERLIGSDPVFFLDNKIASWSGEKNLAAFHPIALDHYRKCFSNPQRIHASCEDYRAGQTYDFELDNADVNAGNKISAPTLSVWGASGIPSETDSQLAEWQRFCDHVTGGPIPSGHFLAEENPQDTLNSLLPFLKEFS